MPNKISFSLLVCGGSASGGPFLFGRILKIYDIFNINIKINKEKKMIVTFYYDVEGLENFFLEWDKWFKNNLKFTPFRDDDSLIEDFYMGF